MYKYNKNDLDVLATNTSFLRDNLEKSAPIMRHTAIYKFQSIIV